MFSKPAPKEDTKKEDNVEPKKKSTLTTFSAIDNPPKKPAETYTTVTHVCDRWTGNRK